MNLDLLITNLSNPALLFFMLGIAAVYLKSDFEIPPSSSKFISIYLLFSIGFRGGQELATEHITGEIVASMLFAIGIASLIPAYSYFILRRRLDVYNSAAIAAAFGSVSAVTFITAISYLESQGQHVHGHMIAIMALMESPAIIAGLLLISIYNKDKKEKVQKRSAIRHSLTNGSVLLILGSLIIGFLATKEQAEGIEPFTTDLFKGFLAIFLLDMGVISGRNLKSLFSYGLFPFMFAVLVPLINGVAVTLASSMVTSDPTDRFIFGVLAASASYIAVPAAMKINVPKADPGLYLPMALAVTFPFNITLGIPIYYYLSGASGLV